MAVWDDEELFRTATTVLAWAAPVAFGIAWDAHMKSPTGMPYRLSVVRQTMSWFAHSNVFVEGLVKAGVPE
jgi:hypothetical protein